MLLIYLQRSPSALYSPLDIKDMLSDADTVPHRQGPGPLFQGISLGRLGIEEECWNRGEVLVWFGGREGGTHAGEKWIGMVKGTHELAVALGRKNKPARRGDMSTELPQFAADYVVGFRPLERLICGV